MSEDERPLPPARSGMKARAYGIGGRAPIVRKPIEKTYGQSREFRETAYERRRREAREAREKNA